MEQRFNLDRTSFERFLATASLLQQLQKRAISLDSPIEDLAPQLSDLGDTQQAIQTGALSGDAALLRISALALRLIPAKGAGVWLFSGDTLLYRAGTGTASNDEGLRSAVSVRLADQSVVIHEDGNEDGNEVRRSPLVRSLLVAPIYQGQRIAGGLAVFSEITNCFNDRHVASTRLLCGLAAQALDRAANAKFKQTVTLEREAVLHVIGALVPSLKELVENPHAQPAVARGDDSAAHELNNAPIWSAAGSPNLSIAVHNFPNEPKTEKVQDSLSLLRIGTTETVPQGGLNPTSLEQGTHDSSLSLLEEWAAGMPDIGVTRPTQQSAPVKEVKSVPIQQAVHAPARQMDESVGFTAEVLAAAKQVRNHISALHIQASIMSWLGLCMSALARIANLTVASMNDLVARASRRKYLSGPGSISIKRLVTVMALIIVATVLAVKIGVSRFRLRSAKTATALSHVDNVKPAKTLIVDGSHKRVTDDVTSAALGELSYFEIPGLLRQARFGDDTAAFLIGMAYETGRGVPPNCEKAARWVKEAAMGGDAAAEYNLSLRYRDGDGLLADSEQSEKWLQKAAAQKYPQALTQAGLETSHTHAAPSQP